MHFFAQPALGADARAVAHDQHADQQLWINRRPPGMAVVRRQVLVQFAQIKELVDSTQQMVGGDVVFQVERIEKWRLPNLLKTHHRDKFRSIDG